MDKVYKIGYFLGNNLISLVFFVVGIYLFIKTYFNGNIYYLIFLIIFYFIVKNKYLNKPDYKKFTTQCLIFLIEIMICVGILIYLSTLLLPLENKYDLIQRFVLFYAIYQFIVYSTLTLMNEAKKDAYNTVKLFYEKGLLYFKILMINPQNAAKYKKELYKEIDKVTSKEVLNTEVVINYYKELKNYINTADIIGIEYGLIRINHNLTHLDLKFKFSFFLKKFK